MLKTFYFVYTNINIKKTLYSYKMHRIVRLITKTIIITTITFSAVLLLIEGYNMYLHIISYQR
jgi:hypothetical protein